METFIGILLLMLGIKLGILVLAFAITPFVLIFASVASIIVFTFSLISGLFLLFIKILFLPLVIIAFLFSPFSWS